MDWRKNVTETPAPIQKTKEKTEEKPVEIVEKPTPTIPAKEVPPKQNRASKPLKSQVVRSFNLSDTSNTVKEERTFNEDLSDRPKDQFTEKDLTQYWERFLSILEAENKIPTFNALQSGKVSLRENFLIHFEFNSASLASEFNDQKERLMLFFRENLNNYAIDFEVEIKEDKAVKFIITPSDIFQQMAEKNPLLLKMKEELGLDYNSND